MKKFRVLLIFCCGFLLSFYGNLAQASSEALLYLTPPEGSFVVGSTFTISVYVNTKENEINVIYASLKFDPNILQIINQTSGKSFVSEWLVPPNYSNTGGTVEFKGGIPGGIKTSSGLVSTITFRAKAPGKTEVEFLKTSQVFLNDGKGTPVSAILSNGSYEIAPALSEGPEISSPTHPDPETWYSNSDPIFTWKKEEGVTNFSCLLDQNPYTVSYDGGENVVSRTAYENVSNGIWYFHLKAKKEGVWGKSSNFMIRIDREVPSEIQISLDQKNNFLYFSAKDNLSGIDHYEVSINQSVDPKAESVPFFVEAKSPYKIPTQKSGKFKIVLRVFDKAGNYSEKEESLTVLAPFFTLTNKSLIIKGIEISKQVFFFLIILLLVLIVFFAFKIFERKNLHLRWKKEVREAEKEIQDVRNLERKIGEYIGLKDKTREEEKRLADRLRGEDEYPK